MMTTTAGKMTMKTTMLFVASFLVLLLSSSKTPAVVRADSFELDQEMTEVTNVAASLSLLAYYNVSDEDMMAENNYYSYQSFTDEPDRVVVAEKNGYCYVAFRGLTKDCDDVKQSVVPGYDAVCPTESCCLVRSGYAKAFFNTSFFDDMYNAFDSCVSSSRSVCSETNSNNCLIFTGHNQGAAIASVAAIYYQDYEPYMIGFGQPAAVEEPCNVIKGDRWYRYINTVTSNLWGIMYDAIPLLPLYGSTFYGHIVLLSDDVSGVAYLGMSNPLEPIEFPRKYSLQANNMSLYEDRIYNILKEGRFPVRTTGFPNDDACSMDAECMSGYCDYSFEQHYDVCMDKLGSCETCSHDKDCISDNCLATQQCTNPHTNKVENGCRCFNDWYCESGRCNVQGTGTCEPKLSTGASCTKHSDCASNICARFTCA